MTSVLFVCHGNICRSPMGEFILKHMVEERGIASDFYIESAATSTEEIGNPVYPPAKRELYKHGITCEGHHARQVRREDYDRFDIIIVMEEIHRRILRDRFFGGDPDNKIKMCMELVGLPNKPVDDPWYTGRFEEVYDQIYKSCEALLSEYGY